VDRFVPVDQAHEDELRAQQSADAATQDVDLTLRIDAQGRPTEDADGILCDRRDREHVCYFEHEGRWLPTVLKRGDHVMLSGMPLRVIGPARHREFFLGYWPEEFGDSLLTIMSTGINDRAPQDPAEVPLPINVLPMPTTGEVDELSRTRSALAYVLKAMLALLGR
jgi:hypothetical protein